MHSYESLRWESWCTVSALEMAEKELLERCGNRDACLEKTFINVFLVFTVFSIRIMQVVVWFHEISEDLDVL